MASVTSSVQRQQQFPVPFPGLSSEEILDLCFSLSQGFVTRHGFITKTMTNVRSTFMGKYYIAPGEYYAFSGTDYIIDCRTVFDFLIM